MIDQKEFDEFFHDFLVESTELLEDYEKNLLELEAALKSPDITFADIQNYLQAMFRSIHTIKGLSGMMDFNEVKTYTHEAEEILDLARSNQLVFRPQQQGMGFPLVDLMFDIMDTTKRLISAVIRPDDSTVDLETVLQKLHTFRQQEHREADVHPPDEFLPEGEEPKTENDDEPEPALDPKTSELETTYDDETVKAPADKKVVQYSSSTIRVDTRRLDDLLDTVGELVIGKNRLQEVSKTLIEWSLYQPGTHHVRHGQTALDREHCALMAGNLSDTVDQLTHLIVNLQESSMKLRMVPVGYTFRKFQRLVRDQARKSHKQIALDIVGESTEVDRAVIESMEDPLLHIIRNAIDHGIESPDERLEVGKSPVGQLLLRASQENNAIVIEIKDDGRGIDPENVYRKALQNRLIEPSQQLTQKEILNLIFLPGFSTADVVTDVSGRGVGMDVVRKNVLKLNGLIDINSDVGRGTSIIVKLPLTLAIIRVLLVKIGSERYSIPISNVVETFRIKTDDIQHINGHEAVQMREQVLPLVRLDDILNIEGGRTNGKAFVVVAGIGEKRVGFIVDMLINQQDIVIKPLGDYLKDVSGFSGATVLGDGSISLVLDLGTLWQEQTRR